MDRFPEPILEIVINFLGETYFSVLKRSTSRLRRAILEMTGTTLTTYVIGTRTSRYYESFCTHVRPSLRQIEYNTVSVHHVDENVDNLIFVNHKQSTHAYYVENGYCRFANGCANTIMVTGAGSCTQLTLLGLNLNSSGLNGRMIKKLVICSDQGSQFMKNTLLGLVHLESTDVVFYVLPDQMKAKLQKFKYIKLRCVHVVKFDFSRCICMEHMWLCSSVLRNVVRWPPRRFNLTITIDSPDFDDDYMHNVPNARVWINGPVRTRFQKGVQPDVW